MAPLPGRLERLPAELQDSVIGYAVANNVPINLIRFDMDLDVLTRPFSNDEEARVVAENEALKSNTFVLDADEMTVEWFPPEGDRAQPRWAAAEGPAAQSLQDRIEDPVCELEFRPRFLATTAEGQMYTLGRPLSPDICAIRHLEVHLAIVAKGHNFDLARSASLDKDTREVLDTLPLAFPRLETLHVVVQNAGVIGSTAGYIYHGRRRKALGFPRAVAKERQGKAHRILKIVTGFDAGVVRRGLRMRKSLTFVQKMGEDIEEQIVRYEADAEGKMPSVDKLLAHDRVRVEF